MSDAAKTYASQKFDWIHAIARDQELSHFAVRVAVELSRHFDSREPHTTCRPRSHEWLANQIGATRRGIQKAIEQLEHRQYLSVLRTPGHGNANRYTPLFNNSLDNEASETTANAHSQLSANNCSHKNNLVRTDAQSNANESDIYCERSSAKDFLSSPLNIPEEKKEFFVDFWKIYIVRKQKEKSESEFEKAVKAGADPCLIVEGARRYSQRMERELAVDRSKLSTIPWPAKWIEESQWLNEFTLAERDPARAFGPMLDHYITEGKWISKTPRPGLPGCIVPDAYIVEHYSKRGLQSPFSPHEVAA